MLVLIFCRLNFCFYEGEVKKMCNVKNFFAAMLLVFAVTILGNAEAAIVTDKLPLQCYVDHKVTSYDTGSGQPVGWIDPEVDLVRITVIDGNTGVAMGTHPGRNGTVERLFWARDVFADTNYSNRNAHVSGYHEVYRTQNSGATIGSVRDEDVTVVADNGNRAQIIYRLDNGTGYKMGWVSSSIVYGGVNPNPQPQTKDFPSSIYLTQVGNSTCTLVSAAMMLRAKAYLNGNNSWNSITENSLRSTAWIEHQGLRHEFSYQNMRVSHVSVSGISVSNLKNLLNQHPEGIVIHCSSLPHAVWVISYSGDTFYCSDPLRNYSGDKRALDNSYLGRRFGSQSNILNRVTAYWYIP